MGKWITVRTLHMAAISSVQHNPDLHAYYQREVQEGKNKMSVINAVRNKLLHRIVAVVNRGTPYELQLKNNYARGLVLIIDIVWVCDGLRLGGLAK
ncbi:MAG: hypothetical protein JNL53_09720 [Cyclobacteriaceae bacterium]|nr:hypothetical protein [Cyclobacteriaceae bacterium]